MTTKIKKTRSQRNASWIENFCRVPAGPRKGDHVVLKPDQKQLLANIYDHDNTPRDIAVIGEMAAYIALLHTVGIEAPRGDVPDPLPDVHPDPWSLWNATSPMLQEFLERDGAGAIVCRDLGTRWPRSAASET